ncbi:MAG: tetratricopeptide repeat protein [Melioribacteraceae bacterium]|nr:tetratricopeptide repeat protein [Melioribacteraceae bacterium]
MKIFQQSVLLLAALVLINCTSKNDKDYYDSAKSKIEAKKYSEALTEFETLLKEFPESTYKAEVILEIGKLYHGKVNKEISELESYNRAVTNYLKVYTEYPKYEGSAKALFMSGFILANEIKNLDSAKATYKLFLEKYPNDNLAPSVQSELDNLGMDPDEILQKIIKETE